MTGEGTDDRRLIADHLAGDPEAFAALVRRHRDRLWAVALRTLGDPEEAADALQDALISALRGAAGYRGDAEVTTWLHRVVVNACLDRLRRRRSRPSVPLEGHDPASRRDDHAATAARLDVHAALARLPEQQRLAVVLVDLEDLTVAEAAGLLGVAEGTVKSRCFRGRMALAQLLREEPLDGPEPRNAQSAADPGVPAGSGGSGVPAGSGGSGGSGSGNRTARAGVGSEQGPLARSDQDVDAVPTKRGGPRRARGGRR